MAAPVVPMKLASRPPAAMNAELVSACAGRSPWMRIPPLIVYRLNNSMIKGMYS